MNCVRKNCAPRTGRLLGRCPRTMGKPLGDGYNYTRHRTEHANMDLLARLMEDMKTALKSGQKDRLMVIRMLISDVKNVDLAPKPTTPEQAVESYAKKLRKSAEEYEKLGKPQEVTKLRQEIAVVEEYLPKKASPEQT